MISKTLPIFKYSDKTKEASLLLIIDYSFKNNKAPLILLENPKGLLRSCPKLEYSFKLNQRHRQTAYKTIISTTIGKYNIDKNKIVVYVNPKVINADESYKYYGLRGLIRSISVILVHELTHWATELKDNSGHESDLWDKTLNSIVYRTTSYSLYPHESFYKNNNYEGV
jgi:hypothetical protein